MPQALTLKNVKAKARAAYAARKLTAQHPHQEKRNCFYSVGDYHCAVGAALNKSVLKALLDEGIDANNNSGFGELVRVGIVSSGEEEAICMIQSAHDDWARHSLDFGAKHPETIAYRKQFLEAIA